MGLDYIKKGETRVLGDGTVVECTESGVKIVHNNQENTVPKSKLEFQKILPTQLTKKEIMFLEDHMRPKKMSECGFLDHDERLMDVYLKDKLTLDKYDLTFEDIYDKLKYFFDEATLNRNVTESFSVAKKMFGQKYKASITQYMGFQECPFEELRDYHDSKQGVGSCDITIYNTENETKVTFSELHLHLVKYHNFFEGNTEYRLDPIDVIKCFEMADFNEEGTSA